ncbi:hypothetical protein AVEN_176667-1 [Araneus ventricosus]|uniref:Uncharacterized protein n=1 Tax=Araneus ventricosus TaxID=182803 RepID=A0A4Y2PTX7_ARAVE|nr:hypothetical protein AVEN_176667-1 [Araneus ventricosus]
MQASGNPSAWALQPSRKYSHISDRRRFTCQMGSFFFILRDSANAVPATKNYAPQATAICGCDERQPSEMQWRVSARGSLLLDQGIPSAR